MIIELQSVTRRLMGGLGPIRIAVPAWRLPRGGAAAAAGTPRVSQAELLDLFHNELRPAKRIVKKPDADFTLGENVQRQSLARLRTALYAL